MPVLTGLAATATLVLCSAMPIISLSAAVAFSKVPRLQHKYLSPLRYNADVDDNIEMLRARLNASIVKAYLDGGKVYFSDGTILNVRYKNIAYGYIESWKGSTEPEFTKKRGTWNSVLACREIERIAKENTALDVNGVEVDLLKNAVNTASPELLTDDQVTSVNSTTKG